MTFIVSTSGFCNILLSLSTHRPWISLCIGCFMECVQEVLTSKDLVITEEDMSIARESLCLALFMHGPYIPNFSEEEEAGNSCH